MMEATGSTGSRSGISSARAISRCAGQCGARQERAGPQDRRERRDLARRSAGAWPDSRQFRPRAATQELRGLLRTRKQLVRERASHVQRLQKTLEDANIKLNAISDVLGMSGRAMIQALIDGETNPARLADLAHRRIKSSPELLREALRGRVTEHHRFLLALHLKQIDALERPSPASIRRSTRVSSPFAQRSPS